MINTDNYFSITRQIDWDKMPEALAKGHVLVQGASQDNWSAFDTNDNIKRVVIAYFQKLSEYLDKNPAVSPTQENTIPSIPDPPQKKQKHPGKKHTIHDEHKTQHDEVSQTTEVENIDTDVQFIRRYSAMHGKVKSQAQVLTLLHSLQKAILERKIRKDSPYCVEVESMQNQLIRCYEKMGDMVEIKIDGKNLKRYLEIAHSQEGMTSIALLKAYVSLNGKKDVKDKAERLMHRMKKSADQGKVSKKDKYAEKLNEAFNMLKSYTGGDTAFLNINKAQLNGLMGIIGEDLFSQKKSLNCSSPQADETLIVGSAELLKMDFHTIGLKGKYHELIGDPSVGFTAMVYGLPKSGKSTMCLDFANHLATHHGKVLFCAVEEGFGYTLKEKVERLKAHHPSLFITDQVPENLNDFEFVFIDSVSKAGIDVNDIDKLRKIHPEISFIFIYHTTKEGNFKGVNSHAHEVDVIVKVDKGQALSTGRFNAGGKMKIETS